MAIRCFKSLKKTVSISYNSVNIQRDIISIFTPALSISCLDFASLILVQMSVDKNPPPSKVSLFYYRPFNQTSVEIQSAENQCFKLIMMRNPWTKTGKFEKSRTR